MRWSQFTPTHRLDPRRHGLQLSHVHPVSLHTAHGLHLEPVRQVHGAKHIQRLQHAHCVAVVRQGTACKGAQGECERSQRGMQRCASDGFCCSAVLLAGAPSTQHHVSVSTRACVCVSVCACQHGLADAHVKKMEKKWMMMMLGWVGLRCWVGDVGQHHQPNSAKQGFHNLQL